MNQIVFSQFLSSILLQERYEDQGDGTAVDTWFRDFNELIRGAERDATAEVLESAAVISDEYVSGVRKPDPRNAHVGIDISEDIRAIDWEPD